MRIVSMDLIGDFPIEMATFRGIGKGPFGENRKGRIARL